MVLTQTPSVAAQNFEYKMSNILDKPLCVTSFYWPTHIFTSSTYAVNLSLATSPCFRELSAHIGTLPCKTTPLVKDPCRNTSSARKWSVGLILLGPCH